MLVAVETILRRSRFSAKRCVIAIVSSGEASDVCDILGECLLPVHGKIRKRLVGVVLCREPCGGFFEMLQVRIGPPIAHTPFRIEGATFRVEGMANLVADDRSDGAVVRGVGSLRIEKRRLQNGCRKTQGIVQRQIHRVHGLRRHGPLFAVHRFA